MGDLSDSQVVPQGIYGAVAPGIAFVRNTW